MTSPAAARRTLPPSGYSALQILLHWVVALLVIFQLFSGEGMSAIGREMHGGPAATAGDRSLADWHWWAGVAVLVLMVLRLGLRLWRGAPPPTPETPPLQAQVARLSHGLFYLLLLAMPLSGLGTIYVTEGLGALHTLGKPVLIVLICVHAAAAVWHQVMMRDGTLMRMLRPGQ